MLGRIHAIALNTFREAVRRRFLYAVVILAAGLDLFAIVLGELSLHHEARVARDVGLGAISLLGSLTAIILGAVLLDGEVQRRTIHTILARPMDRHEFVLGKYLGMVMALTVLVALLTLAMAGLLYLQGASLSPAVARAVVLAYTEILVVASIAVFFSSFSSPVLSGVLTAGLWRVGHCTPEMRSVADSAGCVGQVSGITLRVVPDLHLFTISGGTVQGEHVTVHGDFVSWGYVATTVAYGALYLAVLLVLAMIIFSRRDFA